jgi:hypothetical protein
VPGLGISKRHLAARLSHYAESQPPVEDDVLVLASIGPSGEAGAGPDRV